MTGLINSFYLSFKLKLSQGRMAGKGFNHEILTASLQKGSAQDGDVGGHHGVHGVAM